MAKYLATMMIYAKVRTAALLFHFIQRFASPCHRDIWRKKYASGGRGGLLHSPHAAGTTTRQLVDPTRPYLSCHRSRAKAHSGASTHDVHPEREREPRNNPTLLTNFLSEGEDSKNVKNLLDVVYGSTLLPKKNAASLLTRDCPQWYTTSAP